MSNIRVSEYVCLCVVTLIFFWCFAFPYTLLLFHFPGRKEQIPAATFQTHYVAFDYYCQPLVASSPGFFKYFKSFNRYAHREYHCKKKDGMNVLDENFVAAILKTKTEENGKVFFIFSSLHLYFQV